MAESSLLNVMQAAVKKAGRAIARDFGEIENLQGKKQKPTLFIENTKKNAEKVLLDELNNARPEYGYISSLKTHETKAKEKWLINIISGEVNFSRAIPQWSISLALEDDKGIVAGVVYDVVRDELYYAHKGYGAFVNSRRLKISDVKSFDDIVVFSSFNAEACGAPMTRIAQGTNLYNKCVKTIRSMGDIALDIVYVAAGKGEISFSNSTHSYEVAAAGIIAKEAGAFVSSLKGNKDFVYSNDLIVASPSLHAKAIKLLNI
jgi:myo-inositol-1(or 4)-monophosphatase